MVDVSELMKDPFLTPGEIARMFGVKPYTVRQWIKDGKFPAEKMQSGRLKVRLSTLQKFAQEQFGDDSDSDA